jgi:hypothetical protein
MFNLGKTRHICPVCGFPLKYPADDANICPSCGVQFGYDDADHDYLFLRTAWLERGAKWSSKVSPAPKGFDGLAQLSRLAQLEGEPSTFSQPESHLITPPKVFNKTLIFNQVNEAA